jgi:hypothetical protein
MGIQLAELLTVTVAVTVRPNIDFGVGRRYVAFESGSLTGRDGLSGKLLSGGVDWQLVRPDGVIEIDAHYALSTDDQEIFEVRSTGLRRASTAVAARKARCDPVETDEYYSRTHVRLRTAAPRLTWMNDCLAVSTGRREPDLVTIEVHEVL